MYHASEFASRAGVTVRALHHYDRLGLLKPSARSRAGYRLYGEGDFARLQQIVTLKFIGFPLGEIRSLLGRKRFDLAKALRMQRRVIEQKRKQLDRAIRAIERAEQIAAAGERPDAEVFQKIIEEIEMQTNMEWVKKYYTKEQLEDLARRGTPEVLEKGQRDWAALIRDVEASLGEDPAGEKAQALADRWQKLIEAFTGGDPGIATNLKKLYADQANWPATFQKPYSNEAGAFIAKAVAARKKK